MLDLDSDSTTGLILLDHLHMFVIDLERRAEIKKKNSAKRKRRERNAYIFPSEMMSFFFVSGSTRTTQSGVPTRSDPSIISQPRIIAANYGQLKYTARRNE